MWVIQMARNKGIVNIEERLSELAETNPRSDEMYILLKKLAYIYINQNKFVYGYNGVEDVCHDVAADVQMAVIAGKRINAWMYYLGKMIKLSYVTAQRRIEHETISVEDDPELKETIKRMCAGSALSCREDFDLVQRNMFLDNAKYLVDETMDNTKFVKGSKEYNAVYNNLCINLVRELDGEEKVYFRIDDSLKLYVDLAINQFKKNFRNSGFMESLYDNIDDDLEMMITQADHFEKNERGKVS